MNNVQAVLILALLIAVLRVTLFQLSTLPGHEGTSLQKTSGVSSEVDHIKEGRKARKSSKDSPKPHPLVDPRQGEDGEGGGRMEPCRGDCPCPRRDRDGVVTCPCWTHCIFSAPPIASQAPKTGEELIEEMKEIMNPRLGDPLPKRGQDEAEDMDEGGSGEQAHQVTNPKLLARLRKGQFNFAGRGFAGPGGDKSEGALEAYTVMARDNTDSDGTTQFTSPSGTVARSHFEPEIVGALPATDYPVTGEKVYRSCAIVGNSGTLLGSKHGPEIDSHEAVMRINYAPYKGFEADVGSKTTIDFSNRENARRILKNQNVQWRDSTILFFEVSSPTNRRQMFVPLIKKFPDKQFHFIHPSFINRAMSLWFDMKTELEARRSKSFHDKPMSGFMAVLYMMQSCRQLDLYGFEAYTKKRPDSPYHYFDKVEGVTTVHSFDMAIDMYRMLGEVYPLSIK